MQNELDIVRDVSMRLDGANIGYMLTGSIAMNYYTEPRMTCDIDLVVALRTEDTTRIFELFSPDYYVSREAVETSIHQQSLFNLIHSESVIKVDCIVRKQNPFRLNEFNRRQRVKLRDFETWIVSKEDLILSKLFWAKDSHSEFQLRDVRPQLHRALDRRIGCDYFVAGNRMTDTPPEIAELVRQKLMALSGEERFMMGVRSFEAAREIVLASLPKDLSPIELKRQLYQRIYGEPLPF